MSTGVLYHFSEDPGISRFEPRAVPGTRPPDRQWLNEPLVWAIDEWHSPAYFFPRECPRILWWPVAGTTEADRERYIPDPATRMVACIEWEWFERLARTQLYRYTFARDGFVDVQDHGVHVSRDAVVPSAVERIDDLVAALQAASVELRVMPSLLALRGMWNTTLHVSGIRLRNARGWEA